MTTKRLLINFAILIIIVVSAQCYADDFYYGTGDNVGSGWRQDSSGSIYGTRDNVGKGWQKSK